MSGLHLFDPTSLLKSALIALVLIVGATLFVGCAEGVGVECEHACCSSALHARLFQRIVRGLKQVRLCGTGPLLTWLHGATGRASDWHAWLPSAQPALEAAPLRI